MHYAQSPKHATDHMADMHDYDAQYPEPEHEIGETRPPTAKRPRTQAQQEAFERCKAKRDAAVAEKRRLREEQAAFEKLEKKKQKEVDKHRKLYHRQLEALHTWADPDEDVEELITGAPRQRAPPPSPSPSPPPQQHHSIELDIDDLATRIAKQLQPPPPAQPKAPAKQYSAPQQAKRPAPQPATPRPLIRFV